MEVLGHSLYVAGDELLTVSARLPTKGPALGNGAISIRNAGDQLLDLDWEHVAGELETASVSCEEYLPEIYFRGLVDLFMYEEPAPECEWSAARASFYMLAGHIEARSSQMLNQMDGRYREEAQQALSVTIESLIEAYEVFDPNVPLRKFPDPRDTRSREGRGIPRQPKTYTFPWERGKAQFRDQRALEDKRQKQRQRHRALRQEAAEAVEGYAYATLLLGKVDVELEAADSLRDEDSRNAAKRTALRRLLRDLHPDQNPDREQEVMPVFEYVQRLREDIK